MSDLYCDNRPHGRAPAEGPAIAAAGRPASTTESLVFKCALATGSRSRGFKEHGGDA